MAFSWPADRSTAPRDSQTTLCFHAMPTLKRRTNPNSTPHPRQTAYYIHAYPSDVGNITYQVDARAAEFLTETCGYSDGDALSWSLVQPLRQLRDLFTLDEGRPREHSGDDGPDRVTVPDLDQKTRRELVAYLNEHPDVRGNLGTFETKLANGEHDFMDGLQRAGYTPSTHGHDTTGNESLDRIAEEYFGEGAADTITWNGEEISAYISVTDRDGTVHEFPAIESRFAAGERLRLSRDLYRRWGPEIGQSDVVSRRYEPGDQGFPNRWIGQREGAPEPSLEAAESPRAFFYRTLAGRGGFAPGSEAESDFADVCEYSLEVYKANFPVAVDPQDLQTEYVTVEEATCPWNDFQVPPDWIERYADTGGLPPLKAESGLSERDQEVLSRHAPAGSEGEWFDSREQGRELLEHETFGGYLIRANGVDQEFTSVRLNNGGRLQLDTELDGRPFIIEVGEFQSSLFPTPLTMVRGSVWSGAGSWHRVLASEDCIAEWRSPDVDSITAADRVIQEQAEYYDRVASMLTAIATG